VFSVTAPAADLRTVPTDVAVLSLPAGSYWMLFTSTLTSTTQDPLNPNPISTIACSIVGLSASNSVRLGSDANQAVMSLQAVATLSAPSTVTVRCAGLPPLRFSGRSENNQLSALKVGAIH
jgi:hypothetical protein